MHKIGLNVMIILFFLTAAGCAANSAVTPTLPSSPAPIQASPTSLPSATQLPPTPTLADTQTPLPTATETPTLTPEPSQTPTITLTPTRAIAFNQPGLHNVNLCGRTTFHYSDSTQLDFNGPYTLTVDLCVTTVQVNADYTMKFNLEWRLVTWDGPLPSRYMYASNDYMSLGDDLGNGYGRIADSGIVVDNDTLGGLQDGYKCWYLFQPAVQGATTFTLFDSKKKVSVSGIKLWPGK